MNYNISIRRLEDESLSSFFLRASQDLMIAPKHLRNELGLFHFSRKGHPLYKDLDWPYNIHLDIILEHFQLSKDKLSEMITWKFDKAPSFRTSNINPCMWRLDLPHIIFDNTNICPKCLIDSPHWRISWKENTMKSCNKHGNTLIQNCPNCGEAISTTKAVNLTKVIGTYSKNIKQIYPITGCLKCGYDYRMIS